MRDEVGYYPAQFPSQDEIKQRSWEFLQKSFGTKYIATMTSWPIWTSGEIVALVYFPFLN